MTPQERIQEALERAKARKQTIDLTKCAKCDSPRCKNRRGKEIHLCKDHYKEALHFKLCSICYENPRRGKTATYCHACHNKYELGAIKEGKRPYRSAS